jgi:hypothetical protein
LKTLVKCGEAAVNVDRIVYIDCSSIEELESNRSKMLSFEDIDQYIGE